MTPIFNSSNAFFHVINLTLQTTLFGVKLFEDSSTTCIQLCKKMINVNNQCLGLTFFFNKIQFGHVLIDFLSIQGGPDIMHPKNEFILLLCLSTYSQV